MTAVGRSRWTTLLLYGSLTVLAVVWLVPALSALMISTLPLSQTRDGWWNLSLADLTFGNFARAWDQGLSRYVVNSFIITGLAVVLTVSAGRWPPTRTPGWPSGSRRRPTSCSSPP